MQELKTGYSIKAGGQNSVKEWKQPKVNGTAALRCTHQADAVLNEIFGPDLLLTPDRLFVDGSREVWRAWGTVLDTMSAMLPTQTQLQSFRNDVFALMVALQGTYPPENWGSFYIHAIYAHADEYLQYLGSLGVYMNQGAEAKHKEGCLAWVLCWCWGVQGRPSKEEIARCKELAPLRNWRKVHIICGIKISGLSKQHSGGVDGNEADSEGEDKVQGADLQASGAAAVGQEEAGGDDAGC